MKQLRRGAAFLTALALLCTLTLPAAGIVGFISYKLLHFIWN